MGQIEPGDREEMLLQGILNGDSTTNIEPGSRKEAYLKAILENGGGGGGGETMTRPVYVSTTGSDDNDGWTFDTAVATFEKALRLSSVIYAERGVYAENVTVENKNNVVIAPYDNDDWVPSTDPSYVAGTPRQMIEFNGGEVRTPSTGKYLFVSNYEGGLMFDLFSQDPNNPGPDFLDLVANESKKQYRCNVFVNLFNGGKLKLKPVWTQEDLTDDTFTWDPETRLLAMNVTSADWGQDFHTVTILKQTTNLRVQNCKNVRISDLAVKYNYSTCIGVENSDDVTFTNCEASFSATGMGFGFKSTNGRLEHCFAQGNGVDGFNFHEYGYSEMTDCDSFWNWDDGCSHHQGCAGTINGGTFKGNGKAGIAPAYGATVNIFGAICESNDQYGIGYLYDQTRQLTAKGVVNGGVAADNPIGLKVEDYCTVTAVGLKYEGNDENRSVWGTLNEFGEKDPLTVRLRWDPDDNRYYAGSTMAEIAAAIAAGRNVVLRFPVPGYGGWLYEAPLAIRGVGEDDGEPAYYYQVQQADIYNNAILAIYAQGFAGDVTWRIGTIL